jgi:hypothetical protein
MHTAFLRLHYFAFSCNDFISITDRPHDRAEAAILWICIPEVPGSNLGWVTGYPG